MSTPAAHAADVLAAHYPAVREALETARSAWTGYGPNKYFEALVALDAAVFGLSGIPARCGTCGGEVVPVDEDESHWRHVPPPDPVTEFLDDDHDAAPADGDSR